MYCVRCGVKLENGVRVCPLCGTPVWNPDHETDPVSHFNAGHYPQRQPTGKYLILGLITFLLITVCVSAMIACLKNFGSLSWSGYVLTSVSLFYILFLFPIWFKKYHPVIFLPIDFAAIAAFLAYINARIGGHWFMSFAFPLTGLVFLITYLGMGLILLKIPAKTKALLGGIYFFMVGGITILIEYFSHITYGTPMFRWSLYTAFNLGLIGVVCLLVYFIRPFRQYLSRKIFF